MDETLYREWWQLHLRSARGESLDADERSRYETGLRQLDSTETKPLLTQLRTAWARLESLRASHAELVARGQQLDKEIAALESTLDEETRRLLGVKD